MPFKVLNDFVRNKFCKIKGADVKLVNLFGRYYWKQMDNDEFKKKINKSIIRVEDVRSKDDLERFCSELHKTNQIDLYNDLPYLFFIIDAFNKDESLLIMYYNHCWADGFSLASVYGALSD